ETGFGARAITLGYVACSVIALLHRRYWKETLLVGLMVFGLMGPYLIMPNHSYAYQAQKWLVWQVLVIVAAIHITLGHRRIMANFLCMLACAAVTLPTAWGSVNKTDKYYHMSRFVLGSFEVARNMPSSLEANREEL